MKQIILQQPAICLQQQKKYLTYLQARLQDCNSLPRKIELLQQEKPVLDFFASYPYLYNQSWMQAESSLYLFLQLIVIEQAQNIWTALDLFSCTQKQQEITVLFNQLQQIQNFYSSLGGIIGYHLKVIELLLHADEPLDDKERQTHVRYFCPQTVDIAQIDCDFVQKISLIGLQHLPNLAEMYPVGGCGDRLGLVDPHTEKPLPVASLLFCGRSLLEGLVRDLQAREYLYYQLFDVQIVTPIALMTSQEETNHEYIWQLCQNANWFGRATHSFYFFKQPLVPVVSEEGQWLTTDPLKLYLKPGGHGALWQAAQDAGVFDWLREQSRRKILIRQINNPIAGVDHGLLAFTGYGCVENKKFGFASCQRLVHASEGMNVVIEKRQQNKFQYAITNIEYTEFAKRGIADQPQYPGSLYSNFPANTNILFADIDAIEKVIEKDPVPGPMINMKEEVLLGQADEPLRSVRAGRLESMMQNIAEQFAATSSTDLEEQRQQNIPTFLTYNQRQKTISVTKKPYTLGSSALETPEGCFYDLMQNGHELLKEHCHFTLPSKQSIEQYLQQGPNLVFLYHPALGPLYSVIAQKLRHGSVAEGSELQLEIAEVDIEDLHLQGSLRIETASIMGHYEQGLLHYSKQAARCKLHRVSVCNRGMQKQQKLLNFWQNQIACEETLSILLEGNAEFEAEDVQFSGNHIFRVPSGHRMIVYQRQGQLHFHLEPIASPTWYWQYVASSMGKISLQKIEHRSA